MDKSAGQRPATIAMMAGGFLAVLLYLWFLSLALAGKDGPGDSVVGQAFAILTVLALLWGLLFVLLVLDRALGGSSWPRRAGYWLVPAAAIGTLCASDYPGRWLCQLAFLGLPLMVGAYLAVGRLPVRQASPAQATLLLPIAALSAYAFVLFLS